MKRKAQTTMTTTRRIGVWYAMAIPVLAGMSTLELPIEGFNYTGYIWVVLLPLGLYLLAVQRLTENEHKIAFPCWPWVVWCGLVTFSLLWCEDVDRRNVQEAGQFIMPLVVGLVAAAFIRTPAELRGLLASFGVAYVFLAIYTAMYASGSFDMEWMSVHLRSATLTATLVGCVAFAFFPRYRVLPILGWGACILLDTLTSSRTATLILLALPVLHPLYRTKLWNVAAVAVFLVLGIVLFYTPVFQAHFFESGSGTLSDVLSGEFIDFGRADAWSKVWEEAWEHPLLGAGIGTAFDFVPTVWEDSNHVHNDYLRVFFELGLVGFALFVFIGAWQLVTLYRAINNTSDDLVRTAFAAAWLGFLGLLISCLTDNTIVYHVYYVNPLFAVMGAAFGVAGAKRQRFADGETPHSRSADGIVEHDEQLCGSAT